MGVNARTPIQHVLIRTCTHASTERRERKEKRVNVNQANCDQSLDTACSHGTSIVTHRSFNGIINPWAPNPGEAIKTWYGPITDLPCREYGGGSLHSIAESRISNYLVEKLRGQKHQSHVLKSNRITICQSKSRRESSEVEHKLSCDHITICP